jgi:hypothetical protein
VEHRVRAAGRVAGLARERELSVRLVADLRDPAEIALEELRSVELLVRRDIEEQEAFGRADRELRAGRRERRRGRTRIRARLGASRLSVQTGSLPQALVPRQPVQVKPGSALAVSVTSTGIPRAA